LYIIDKETEEFIMRKKILIGKVEKCEVKVMCVNLFSEQYLTDLENCLDTKEKVNELIALGEHSSEYSNLYSFYHVSIETDLDISEIRELLEEKVANNDFNGDYNIYLSEYR
jgi:hypothetical protein